VLETTMNQGTLFIDQVNRLSDQTIELCYHCHKCTAGCPVVQDMQYGPDRILRMVQFGDADKLLSSSDIWLCASCETCGTRCPNQIDIARVMDALRQIALASGAHVAEPNAYKFTACSFSFWKGWAECMKLLFWQLIRYGLATYWQIWTAGLLCSRRVKSLSARRR
jgi:heterodisulfide reductase subunit C